VVEHYLDTVGVTGSNPVSRIAFGGLGYRSRISPAATLLAVCFEEKSELHGGFPTNEGTSFSSHLRVPCAVSGCSSKGIFFRRTQFARTRHAPIKLRP
jgi:hypothetical protein